jgi:sensor histidine kinase YesM
MTLHDFIFTKKTPEKFFRHIAFWIAQHVFWIQWAAFFVVYFSWKGVLYGLERNCFLVLEMSYTYLTVYYLSPEFLAKKRYTRFILFFSILTLCSFVLYVLYHIWFYGDLARPRDQLMLGTWYNSINFFTSGPPVICAMFLSIKMLKNYYIKMEEKLTLTKENASAELQLLKAQIHPHFLFNTLNNIYSFTLDRSPQAPQLILSLSAILRYMIFECEPALVPLEKELNMICNYLKLEKVRYGDRLDLRVNIGEGYKNKSIAPLLMTPFIENSFKHGTSQVLQHPWINLYIYIEENSLRFELSNSKPLQDTSNDAKRGIGLINVQKRLQLLYPGQHSLNIESGAETFTVYMITPLSDITHSYAEQ